MERISRTNPRRGGGERQRSTSSSSKLPWPASGRPRLRIERIPCLRNRLLARPRNILILQTPQNREKLRRPSISNGLLHVDTRRRLHRLQNDLVPLAMHEHLTVPGGEPDSFRQLNRLTVTLCENLRA